MSSNGMQFEWKKRWSLTADCQSAVVEAKTARNVGWEGLLKAMERSCVICAQILVDCQIFQVRRRVKGDGIVTVALGSIKQSGDSTA